MAESGDLFELAQDLSRLVGCPVTIEDRDTIVIAYAGEHQDVDAARVETILNRQVPVRYRTAIAEAGVFDQLRDTDDVIVVDLPELQMAARAVVALRSEGELLGSVWAALGRAPTPEEAAALRSAAPVIARQVLLARRRADRVARERDDLVADLLRGGETAVQAAEQTGLGDRLVVVAVRGEDPDAASRLAGALTLNLSAVAPRSACALQDDTLYCVLPADAGRRVMGDFLTRLRAGRAVVAGLGEPVAAIDLPHSRAVADDVARALLRRGDTGRVAGLTEVFADVLVDRVRGFLSTHRAASPLAALERYDAAHDTGLVAAVDAWLASAGNVAVAAESLHVHTNTVRNRLHRARESCGIDVEDPATRLALMVHLAARRTR
ncbi:PucR family transcriptional regulator [Nocardioides terrisoli]|uniref:PucR family transcriptional regulator n=1 Tax=Nocardioides terrisoli TaxID=3388267 RepID=UPI00287B9F55|nr:helix-turn-helix domain-containing protein [Nocardioides marmorisolisilvae]